MICHGFMALFDGSLGMWMRGGDSESAMSLCILAPTDLILAQHSEYLLFQLYLFKMYISY
jgi:hypothetical protein